MKPELLDIIELLVNLPEHVRVASPVGNRSIGSQGTIVECHDEDNFEVEFTNPDGETTALCVLSSQQFIIVWKAKTKEWTAAADKLTDIFNRLPETKREEVLDFAKFLHQKV